MREIRLSGSQGGGGESNRSSLPLSTCLWLAIAGTEGQRGMQATGT